MSKTEKSSGFQVALSGSNFDYKGPEMSYSIEKNKPKRTEKRKICFQLLDINKVEIEPNFILPSEAIYLLKQYNAHFSQTSNFYQVTFKDYHKVLNDLEKLCKNEAIKKKLEVKRIHFESIPNLPLEVVNKTKELTEIQFKTLLNTGKKIKSVTIDINYTKDPKKTFDLLPTTFSQVLYQFQKEGIIFGMERKGRMLLADEMGVGKTIQAIGIALLFQEDWPILIICPSSLKLVWRDEILKWIPQLVSKEQIQIISKGNDTFESDKKFYLISYELTIKYEVRITEMNFNFIIADEAHYLKSPEAKRTKCLLPIIQKSKRILLLTGTPILSRPVELFSLLSMLRPDLFNNFYVFGNRYCDPKKTNFGTDWTGSSYPKELHYILKNLMIRRLKKDVMSQLPPKKRQKIEIPTDQKIVKQIMKININTEDLFAPCFADSNYDPVNKKGDDDYYGDHADNEEDEDNPLHLFNRVYRLSAEAKCQGVRDYIHYLIENKCKFLIFAHHQIMLDAIETEVRKSKVHFIRIDGRVKLERRQEYVNKFQTDEQCLVAILSLTACYKGITLTAASTVVFSELHMTPAIMIQAEDRAHRIGQEHNCVNIHYLYGPNTLDEALFKMLNQKQNIFTNTLDKKAKNMEVKGTLDKIGEFQREGEEEYMEEKQEEEKEEEKKEGKEKVEKMEVEKEEKKKTEKEKKKKNKSRSVSRSRSRSRSRSYSSSRSSSSYSSSSSSSNSSSKSKKKKKNKKKKEKKEKNEKKQKKGKKEKKDKKERKSESPEPRGKKGDDMWTYVKRAEKMWDNEYKFSERNRDNEDENSQNSNTEDNTGNNVNKME